MHQSVYGGLSPGISLSTVSGEWGGEEQESKKVKEKNEVFANNS